MGSQKSERSERTPLAPLILIVSLFLFWGLANSFNGILVKQFRKAFTLDYLHSELVDTSFYIGYFVFALPAALFIQRFGYKAAVIAGLVLYGVGALLFFPAAEVRAYPFFLGALFVIASGLAFLETAANPLMTVLGPARSSERRLNFAQSFNAFGLIAAVLIGQNFILSDVEHTPQELAVMPRADVEQYFSTAAHAVQVPYLVLGAVVIAWAALVAAVKFPAIAVTVESTPSGGLLALFGKRQYIFGVIAQFFYVGAQASIWSNLIFYAQHAVPGMSARAGGNYLTASFVCFLIGRFGGTALMGVVRPERLLALFAAPAVLLTLTAAFVGGSTGLFALTATSFFMSIMFPTIFASAVRDLGPLVKLGSSLLIMAIIGGALVPLLVGRIADMTDIFRYTMAVPSVCFAVVFAYALSLHAGLREEDVEKVGVA
jgi:MFS transporter, FHS family, L-fucose permease